MRDRSWEIKDLPKAALFNFGGEDVGKEPRDLLALVMGRIRELRWGSYTKFGALN